MMARFVPCKGRYSDYGGVSKQKGEAMVDRVNSSYSVRAKERMESESKRDGCVCVYIYKRVTHVFKYIYRHI